MHHGLLSTQEVNLLVSAYQAGLQAEQTLSNNDNDEEKTEELRYLTTRGKQALDLLVRANLRLVFFIAEKFTNRGVDLEDLISHGVVGLMTACRKFDTSKNFKISTYASLWIKQAVLKAIGNEARTIRLPIHVQSRWVRLSKIKDHLRNENGKEPTLDEIAAEADMKTDEIEKTFIRLSSLSASSLNQKVNEESEDEIGDFVTDQKISTPEEALISVFLKEALNETFQTLTPREIKILELHYGLNDGVPLTLQQIANRLGVSRERIRQLEARAIKKLRTPKNEKILQDFL